MSSNPSRAIATQYMGFNFRSRLEAKWAIFFDLCGWAWSYEPDLDYDGWIPDFAIGKSAALVEVKPFYDKREWTDAIRKICASGCDRDVLLLGADPVHFSRTHEWTISEGIAVGYALQDTHGKYGCLQMLLAGHGGQSEKLEVAANDWGAWINYISGDVGKAGLLTNAGQADAATQVVDRWAVACNAAQWMPRASSAVG